MASEKKSEKSEICPASQFAALDGGTVHYASRRELTKNGGVCEKCRRSFQKAHSRAIKRKPLSVVEFSREQWHPTIHAGPTHTTVAYHEEDSDNGEAFRHYDKGRNGTFRPLLPEYNFESLTDPEERKAAIDYASAAIRKFAVRLLEKSISPKKLWVHLHALCYSARVHPQQERPAAALARELGTTKAVFSLELNYWRDLFGLPACGNAKPEARDKSAAVRLATNGHANRTSLDGLLSALTKTEREAHRREEHVKLAGAERRAELRDRLRPLAALYDKLNNELSN